MQVDSTYNLTYWQGYRERWRKSRARWNRRYKNLAGWLAAHPNGACGAVIDCPALRFWKERDSGGGETAWWTSDPGWRAMDGLQVEIDRVEYYALRGYTRRKPPVVPLKWPPGPELALPKKKAKPRKPAKVNGYQRRYKETCTMPRKGNMPPPSYNSWLARVQAAEKREAVRRSIRRGQRFGAVP